MLNFIWLGIAANPPFDYRTSFAVSSELPSQRASPASTTLNSPAPSASFGLGIESLSRSGSLNRSRKSTVSSSGAPTVTPRRPSAQRLNPLTRRSPLDRSASMFQVQSPPPRQADSKWPRCFASFCGFVGMLIELCPISDDCFDRVVALICLALGQDESDAMPDYALEECHQLVHDMLSSKSGRKGELALRNILEGKTPTISNNRSLKMVEEDRKIARGAVMCVSRASEPGHAC